MELARAQRDARVGAARVESANAVAQETDAHRGESANESRAAAVRESRAPLELGDTHVFRPPVFELDPVHRERERILPPGSPGELGMPYKMLRTQVLKRLDQLGANTLAVMSASNGVGKTLTAINLAIAVASDPGRTVLLVDLDLRNPSIHKRFGIAPESGLEDCLSDGLPVHRAMSKISGYERLTLLLSRERVEHSSDLLRTQRVADVVAEMRSRYANRVLIFDLPPVLQSDDALAFSKLVQAGLVVVREGHTRRDDVERTIELLRDLTIVGTVLNGSREPGRTFY
jgi:Mrp family chromosome partitioning ATPase